MYNHLLVNLKSISSHLGPMDGKDLCIHLVTMKKLLFWKKMLCSGNFILRRLAKCCDARIFALAAKYHIEPHDIVRSSVARIKNSFWFYFSELV